LKCCEDWGMAHTFPSTFGAPTDAESLQLTIEAINRIVVFGERRIQNGKDVTEVALSELRKYRDELESRINAASGSAVNYAKRMPPV
jgi:hypothetical protein